MPTPYPPPSPPPYSRPRATTPAPAPPPLQATSLIGGAMVLLAVLATADGALREDSDSSTAPDAAPDCPCEDRELCRPNSKQHDTEFLGFTLYNESQTDKSRWAGLRQAGLPHARAGSCRARPRHLPPSPPLAAPAATTGPCSRLRRGTRGRIRTWCAWRTPPARASSSTGDSTRRSSCPAPPRAPSGSGARWRRREGEGRTALISTG